MQNSHLIKKILENEILPKFTRPNFKFGVSIVVSFSYLKIKNILWLSHTNHIHIGEKVCCWFYIWKLVSRFFLKRVQKKCSIFWSAWVFSLHFSWILFMWYKYSFLYVYIYLHLPKAKYICLNKNSSLRCWLHFLLFLWQTKNQLQY